MDIKPIIRDSNGLIAGQTYFQMPDGTIDWRKMIPQEFLVVNKRLFESKNLPIPETIEGLEDKHLLILLGGIKKLARIRGFTTMTYQLVAPTNEYVAVACTIEWIPNFETEARAVISSGIGDAHIGNTDGFGRNYLAAIAENRAFVRCVRNFLGINIIGQDEVCSSNTPEESAPSSNAQLGSVALLEKLMNEKNVSFQQLKDKLVSEQVENADKFSGLSDIPKIKIFELIERLRRKKT